ncbi:MAG: GMC family oxidoreductase N-terminal domain-containing protein [Pirellulales bacterium]
MDFDFDAVVFGSGAGGSAFAQSLAKAGKRVLVVERGARPNADHVPLDERTALIEKRPYDDRQIRVNETKLQLYMGGVLGGGTAVFGGVMLRPSTDDFLPGRHYADRLPRELWEWPIGYEDLRDYFDEAERLYAVASCPQEDFSPLHAPADSEPHAVLPVARINERLMAANRQRGLRPFQLPLAIDARRCARCANCAGYLCPHEARRSAAQIVDETAARHDLTVMTDTEVERLQLSGDGSIEGAMLRNRDGSRSTVRARCYALAAGAIGSPAILMRSGIEGPQIGRNYMMHYSPLAVGLFAQPTGANHTFVKQVGFADFYFGTPALREKMGLVQSLPAPGPLMLAKTGMRRWPRCAVRFLRKRMLPLVGIVEDLPNPANRVVLGEDGSIELRHEFSAFDRERGRALAREMCAILRRAGAVLCGSRSFPSREHVAHQCGTLRFGSDARHAAVDRDCRVFGRENLFVVDGSVLPTSLGIGPSLTIVANALRVANVAIAGI